MPALKTLVRLGFVGGLGASVIALGACARPGSTSSGTPTTAVRIVGSPTTMRSASPTAMMPTVAVVATPTAAPTTAPAPTPVQPSGTVPGKKYVVKEGDTLADIANSFGVSIADIIAANNLSNPDVIIVGQELIIPGR